MTFEQAFHALGLAAYNMPYHQFCKVIAAESDAYAEDKYTALKAIGRAMCAFDDRTLASLARAYAETQAFANTN